VAASLAAGLWGIEHTLTLDTPETVGNGYAAAEGLERLPRTLQEATARLDGSAAVREMLGDGFGRLAPFPLTGGDVVIDEAVTDWELARYFEII
jgi:glutamine synthetase